MKKVAGLIRQDSGVGFYRLVQPLRFLKRTGLIKDARMSWFSGDNIWGEKDGRLVMEEKLFYNICKDADVIWSNFTAVRDDMLRMLDARKQFNSKLILDIDDNLYAVHRDNPVARSADVFIKEIELSLKIADGLTVSVPTLKKLYEPLNKNIFVQPNGIDLKLWKPKHKKNKKLKIGWRGAYGHLPDLNLIKSAIEAICKDYDCEFVTFGAKPDFTFTGHSHIEPVGLVEFPKKIAQANFDIGVVPLIDSSYNRCKSNLNILEFSALKVPVVASPTENQKDMKCLYATSNYEWYEKLERLVKDEMLRKKVAEEQYNDLLNRFDMNKLVKPLSEWMDKLERRRDLEPDRK